MKFVRILIPSSVIYFVNALFEFMSGRMIDRKQKNSVYCMAVRTVEDYKVDNTMILGGSRC